MDEKTTNSQVRKLLATISKGEYEPPVSILIH